MPETTNSDVLRQAIENAKVVTPESAKEAVLRVILTELEMKQQVGIPYPEEE